jgi:MHS family citrate/tricarballylate:H+ symporter-like MFS transporter|nr:MFS transporter [uncultured Bradyrhizobium sp.]
MEHRPAQKGSSNAPAVLRVTSGNFLEMYDFFLAGVFAKNIGQTFFPTDSQYASLMLSFASFAISFFMRPLGAIFLGAYVDKKGRRQGLIVTLGIMGIGTAIVAFSPGYAAIGLLAPLLVLIGRLLQGFSAGVELGGVSVYLAEIATPGRKGFYVAWQAASQQLAVVMAAGLGFLVRLAFDKAAVDDFWWRLPFFVGCTVIPFLFLIRRSLQETPEFARRKEHPTTEQIVASLVANWQIILLGVLMVSMTTTSFYTITTYTPTYAREVLKLTDTDALIITVCVALSNFSWLPVMGAISDKVGRLPLLLIFSALALITGYPVLFWLAHHTSFGNTLIALLWFSFLYGGYNGAMTVALTEVVPKAVRVSGFSLTYSLATALFGGMTPLIATTLVHVFESSTIIEAKAAPSLWFAFSGLCGFVASYLIYKRQGQITRTFAMNPPTVSRLGRSL